MEGVALYYILISVLAVLTGIFAVLYILECGRRKDIKDRTQKEADRLREQMAQNAGIFERFFPKNLPELLGIRRVKDITMNLQRSFIASVMSVRVLNYDHAIHTMASDKMFMVINRIFSRLIPVVVQSGGIIDRFDKAGMTGLYAEDSEQALKAAVSLCVQVDDLGESQNYGEFAVGLDHGEVIIGVVGHEQRISSVTMSESVNISVVLQKIAGKYGARILVTEAFVDHVPGFAKNYNSRVLGYFYDSTQDRAIKVYDVYDGDIAERKQSKRKTRMIFEQGVEFYIHGDYEEARLHFVEVLKADRYDLAAKEYLYMCDMLCNERIGEVEICIERF